MPNTANLNLLIETISRAAPEQMIMGAWQRSIACGTAYCFGGWIEALIGPNVPSYADWLGIDTIQTSHLFLMPYDYSPARFDRLAPERRKAIALDVLRTLRDENLVRWPDDCLSFAEDGL